MRDRALALPCALSRSPILVANVLGCHHVRAHRVPVIQRARLASRIRARSPRARVLTILASSGHTCRHLRLRLRILLNHLKLARRKCHVLGVWIYLMVALLVGRVRRSPWQALPPVAAPRAKLIYVSGEHEEEQLGTVADCPSWQYAAEKRAEYAWRPATRSACSAQGESGRLSTGRLRAGADRSKLQDQQSVSSAR